MRLRFKATMSCWRCCASCTSSLCRSGQHRHCGQRNSKELHLSNTQLVWCFRPSPIPMLFQVIGGWVGDRFGRAGRCSGAA